eukprot:8367326-Alexandrium_andersonii.AAC.1
MSVGEDLRAWGVAELDQLRPLRRAAGLDVPTGHLAVWRHRHAPVEHLEAVRGRELREAGVAAGALGDSVSAVLAALGGRQLVTRDQARDWVTAYCSGVGELQRQCGAELVA